MDMWVLFKKKKKTNQTSERWKETDGGIEGVERERPTERFFKNFLLLVYFLNLRKSDRQISSG